MSSAGHEIGFWRLMMRAVSYGIILWGVVYCWPVNLPHQEFFERLTWFIYVYVGWMATGIVILFVVCLVRIFILKRKENGT